MKTLGVLESIPELIPESQKSLVVLHVFKTYKPFCICLSFSLSYTDQLSSTALFTLVFPRVNNNFKNRPSASASTKSDTILLGSLD